VGTYVQFTVHDRRNHNLSKGRKTKRSRTVDELWKTIGAAIGQSTPDECRNYFQAAGYDLEYSENALTF